MADSFRFWSNSSKENIGGGGGYKGFDYQEQDIIMRMMKVDDHVNHQNTTVTTAKNTITKKTKGKKIGGKSVQKKLEKKYPQRGVGIAKLEESIKQKNSQVQLHHGYSTTAIVIPTTSHQIYNQSQNHQIHSNQYPFLHQLRQMNHGVKTNIDDSHNDGGHKVMNYGSASNVNGGHHQQPYDLQPFKQRNNYNGAGYNPSAGSGFGQHGNNNGAAYNPSEREEYRFSNNTNPFEASKILELSSTQKHHCLSQQHCDICINNKLQKNLNYGENIGFREGRKITRYSETTATNDKQIVDSKSDFLELDLGRKWNNNVDGQITNDGDAELLRVDQKGRSSNILMEYEFLPSGDGNNKKSHHTKLPSEKDYQHYSSNYSSYSCIMEESASSSSVRNGDNISVSQSNTDDFLDLSLKLAYH